MRTMTKTLIRRCLRAGMLVFAALTGVASAQMPIVELTVGMYRVEAELAHLPAARATGLMHRPSMPVNHGMVFVFAEDSQHCMWMRNTLLPLSVAFLDAQGRILNIEDMQPQTDDSHCAVAPARFALEMNQGWFVERGIKAGQRVRGVASLPEGR